MSRTIEQSILKLAEIALQSADSFIEKCNKSQRTDHREYTVVFAQVSQAVEISHLKDSGLSEETKIKLFEIESKSKLLSSVFEGILERCAEKHRQEIELKKKLDALDQ